jgi:hypothetical protein
VEIPGWAEANFSLFNALARFALFLCNSFRAARCEKDVRTTAKQMSCQSKAKR